MENDYFKSERLTYRPYCMDDLQTVHSHFNEPSRRRWFYFQEPDCLTLEFAKKEILKAMAVGFREINLLKDGFSSGIVLQDTNELIGFVGLSKFHGPDEELENIEIGYQIAEAYQGKGYATEAVKIVVQWGLAELKRLGTEVKIVAKIEHENWSSRKVAEKAGFTFSHAEQYVSVYKICD